MKQILQSYKNGELWLAEVPAPAVKYAGIVIQTHASFVSAGTEKMLIEFAQKNIIGKALAMPDQVKKVVRKMKTEGILSTLEKVQSKLDQPIPLGYSCSGTVIDVGPGVLGFVHGDRVACGGAGYANHAEYNYIPMNLAVKIPEKVSFEDASCATVASIALQGVRQCDLRIGENACVMGLGLLGLLAGQILKASGVRIIGFDPNPERCRQALELGFDFAVNTDLLLACGQFSKGRGVDAVLITAATKSNEPVTVAGEIARIKGKVIVTGMVGMDIPRDMYYKKELDFKLSLSYGPGRYDPSYEEAGNDYPFGYVRWTEQRNIAAVLDLIAQGKVTPQQLITHRFDFQKSLSAYQLLQGEIEEPYLGIVLHYPQESSTMAPEQTIRTGDVRAANPSAGKPGIAFIGAGNFAKSVLLPHLRKRTDVIRRAVCDLDGSAAAETARKERFEIASTDIDATMADPTINAIFVTTRHDSHCSLIEKGLKAGKHIFVEKPLALTLKDLAALEALTLTSDRVLMVGFNRRFTSHANKIKEYFIDRKTPMIVNYRVNAGYIPPDSWIHDSRIGGGRIVGEACHFIDFASFLIADQPTEVLASSIQSQNTQIRNDDNVCFCVRYADGSMATIQYVAIGSPDFSKERCEVYADSSMAVMDNFQETLIYGKRGRVKIKGKQDKGFSEEIAAFLSAIKNGSPAPIPLKSLCETTRITFAVLQSLKERRSVSIQP
ncbi:MAG: hypothetical protein A2268_13245 [Candidatus Raymondbacteria bacterium RifOxyA12_full_50_37]|uniref:Enoyl reductase (ER) domain-containing protein n=1 Tax=Candidatus Raymondbacteria bacterium RIFOXYD12_FULL_49_13 TaxID=1817890 RepID=A0A1F7EZX0_UNCRA|nr:MAG: hypothetical protein A2268_13245 [Candidatus Raymondbacteria bacterium RifOxyA12_full_50_37]OGJ93027.1 MAG: hypothetical protein A2248_18380 [Candidatus Raymondbacteria bacterium RIFOXYA2_FULL_49_16]OGJ94860.1 MAG: hypothetical protein A2350_15435 [Candidatus Raymondbacteria bacterium RifOxyB12_full_50_8]OGJ99940.1 MAG: hypothetical protein A2519_00360 [Candidatus Raymondbacteria bacterium RIFOXYD12_FULL_49_13]OGK04131.1 MAG: hypothetical protein A2487_14040 [Candidatus Raymondbacteria 